MKTHTIKQAIKKSLRRMGLHFYTNNSLPHGVDVYTDLERLRNGFPLETIFDIGANVGQTSVQLAGKFSQAKIFAFEPFTDTFSRLTANTRHLSQISIFKIALGDEQKTYLASIEPESVQNSLKKNRGSPTAHSEEVTVKRLDAFCAENYIESIDFLKTDTEGFDFEVLRGAGDLLRSGAIGSILCEVAFNPLDQQHTIFLPVYHHLVERGFRFYGLYDTLPLHRNPADTAYCDALFCHPKFCRPS